MAITEADLLYKYTNEAGTTNPETSLGGTLGPNTIPSGIANNIFDDVTGDESSSGKIEYRAIGIHNTLSTHVWMNTKAWITGYTRHGTPVNADTISFWVEKPAGTGGDPDGTIQVIANDTTAPSGATFQVEGAPSSTLVVSGLDYVGSIGADDWSGIWLKRDVPAGAGAYSNRSCTLKVQGETSASPYAGIVSATFVIHWTDEMFSIEKIVDQGTNVTLIP